MLRRILLASVTVGLSLALTLVAAELLLRLLPVNTGLQAQAVNAANPVFRFAPNRAFVWSKDGDFSIVNRGRVNNDGWVNDQDYDPADPRPLLAVVGDSYVEAAMVPWAETAAGRLAALLGPRGRSYSFGASGAPLSQYLIWADYARARYRPALLAIVVVGNDFDESLARYKDGPGFHLYVPGTDGALALTRFDYAPDPLRRTARQSALVRYLILNLQVAPALQNLPTLFRRSLPTEAPPFAGNTAMGVSAERLRDSEAAVAAFFRDLPARAGLPPERVMLVLDGARYPEQVDIFAASYFGRMRRLVMSTGRALGYDVLDLEPLFVARNRALVTRFEFATDGHWNGEGHRAAADAIRGSGAFQAVFPP